MDLDSRDRFQYAVQVLRVAPRAWLQPAETTTTTTTTEFEVAEWRKTHRHAYIERTEPWHHVWVGDREPLAFLRQGVVVERGRDGRVDVLAQRRELVVREELPEHGSPGVGRPADEPHVVQAVAVHAEPRVGHVDSAHQLDRQS